MAGPLEASVAGDVHVQKVAGAGPFVAVSRLPYRLCGPWKAGTMEHLPDGRVGEACRRCDQPWSPAGLATAGADPLLQLLSELTRTAVRPGGTIEQTDERSPRLPSGLRPAVPPAMRRRRRNVEALSSSPDRAAALDRLDKRETGSKSELRVSVQIHPSPPSRVSRRRPTASKEGRIERSAVHNLFRQDN